MINPVSLRDMGRVMEFHSIVAEDKLRPAPNQFMFRKEKRMHWLQHACIWILKKLGCEGSMPCVQFNHKSVQTRDFLAAIREQREYYAQYYFNRRSDMEDLMIVVGGDILADLIDLQLVHPAFASVKDVYHYQETMRHQPEIRYKTFVFDMDVVFCPNVKGAFVIPRFPSKLR